MTTMRTTLTLDDDVAARLRNEARRSDRSFKEVVNGLLRFALNAMKTKPSASIRFVVRTRPLMPRPGLNFDNIEELLDQVDGPLRR